MGFIVVSGRFVICFFRFRGSGRRCYSFVVSFGSFGACFLYGDAVL